MIRLQRTVSVQTFDAEATVAVGRDRPEFLAVARLAADLERPLGGRDISRELLGGLPELVGWRVIDRCVALGLLEQRGGRGPAALTESGAAALEQGAVLVPEEGTWRFFFVDDPLMDDALVHVARIETPNAREERNDLYAAKREMRGRPGPGDRVPPLLHDAAGSGYVWTSVASAQPFDVREVAERGLAGEPGQLRLVVEWEEEQPLPRLALRGELEAVAEDGKPWRVDCPLETPRAFAGVTYDDLWRDLVASSTGLPAGELKTWRRRAGTRVVPVTFDDLQQAARRSMRQDLSVPEVALDGLGRFDPTVLEAVALVPREASDAQSWAEWLQWESLSDYVVPAALEDAAREIAERFPFHSPRLPVADELLRRAKAAPQDPRARFLLAPADLGLWRSS